jgi:hypothetical protein
LLDPALGKALMNSVLAALHGYVTVHGACVLSTPCGWSARDRFP